MNIFDSVRAAFREALPNVDFASLRLHQDHYEQVTVRQDVLEPPYSSRDQGAMVTVLSRGGLGYAATSDLSVAGLKKAFARAREWAEATAACSVIDYNQLKLPHPRGEYLSRARISFDEVALEDKIARLMPVSRSMKIAPRIVDWSAGLYRQRSQKLYLTSGGGEVFSDTDLITPTLSATANQGTESIHRTYGGHSLLRRGGLELLDAIAYGEQGRLVAEEALTLLDAPNCPSGVRDLLLAPDQMTLQIHESIGHPLELDRILGDERNYAGTSFVTLDMFGDYRYGSELLNVTFDPTHPEEAASYAYDDEGMPAERAYLIKDGILQKPLGAQLSGLRAGTFGVANSRADSWRRPPIDRMANLNIEPGTTNLAQMISSTERGVYMRTNCSWSIDDSRNKFQFGCEWAQLIENGELTTVVKKPNYRGISANFWRNLKAVGTADEFMVLGTSNCGKGEPNQAITVGHASPPCLFRDVDVFGGE